MEYSSQSKGVVYHLSPLTYVGSSIRTDLSSGQITLAPANTILKSTEKKVLTIKSEADQAIFLTPEAELS